MFKTEGNLQSAFMEESQANRRYLFFADKADEEGYPQIARLFRAVAEAETVHARNQFNAMDGVGSTKDNLLAGSTAEHREITAVYPPFIEQAESENNERARIAFEYANQVERIHFEYFERALEAVKADQELKDEPYFVCQVCGNTASGQAPEKCHICRKPRSEFKRVE